MESPGLEYSLSHGLLDDPVRYPSVNLSASARQTHQQDSRCARTIHVNEVVILLPLYSSLPRAEFVRCFRLYYRRVPSFSSCPRYPTTVDGSSSSVETWRDVSFSFFLFISSPSIFYSRPPGDLFRWSRRTLRIPIDIDCHCRLAPAATPCQKGASTNSSKTV